MDQNAPFSNSRVFMLLLLHGSLTFRLLGPLTYYAETAAPHQTIEDPVTATF